MGFIDKLIKKKIDGTAKRYMPRLIFIVIVMAVAIIIGLCLSWKILTF